jgi:hypothetical protein
MIAAPRRIDERLRLGRDVGPTVNVRAPVAVPAIEDGPDVDGYERAGLDHALAGIPWTTSESIEMQVLAGKRLRAVAVAAAAEVALERRRWRRPLRMWRSASESGSRW